MFTIGEFSKITGLTVKTLRFYHEKKDGLKVRRKLRIRNYGDDLYFFEIKRKVEKTVLKERVSLRHSDVAGALNGADPVVLMSGRPEDDRPCTVRFSIARPSILAKLDLPEPKKPDTQIAMPSCGFCGVS